MAKKRGRVQLFFNEPSLTRQEFKDECDINVILKKYEKTGLLEHVREYQGSYADLTGVQSYHDALNQVCAAEEAFNSLPATIRKRFQHDPGAFIEFATDPKNFGEMVELGLAVRKPPQSATVSEAVVAQSPTPEAKA